MSRAKGISPLKFDTSLANITCFIRSKSKSKEDSRPARPKRKKTDKPIEFQDKAFLESVVCKILNEGDCQGITDLIDNMVFPNSSNESEGNSNDPHKQEEEQHIQEIFSNWEQRPRLSHPHPLDFYRIISPQGQYEKRQCTTMVYSNNNSMLGSPREQPTQSTNIKSQTNPEIMLPLYPYQYYQLYPRTPSQRKRRTVSGEEVQEYTIYPQKLELDGRTTIMIRHIPNKYSQDMLLEQIGKNHRMKINFLYLPIDHFNTCNVGYAFVNFIHTKFILDFYQEFNGRRWDRFNSQKICQLAYARIQGTTNLMDHYQNPKKVPNKIEERKGKNSVELDDQAIKDINKIIDHQRVEDF